MRLPQILLHLLLPLLATPALATPVDEFSRFPAGKTVENCRELDFNSYFRAQQLQKHLRRDNPERSKPNFGGKYLLLKQEMMMETLWLIADCETGKFLKDTISGQLEYRPDSLLAIVTKPKSDEKPQLQVWRDGEWTRVDPTPAAVAAAAVTPSPGGSPGQVSAAPSPAASADATYGSLYARYPEPVVGACKELDYNSYFRAQTFKGNLIKLNPERSKPNFAGKYLLLKNDVLFERFWLIADCTTGKFVPEIVKGNVDFRPDSALIVVRNSSDFARLSLWRDGRFVELLNPTRTTRQEVENKIWDQEALDLLQAVGAPKGEPRFGFEDLKCVGQQCTVRIFPDPQPRALSAEQAKLAEILLKRWGGELQEGASTVYSIQAGKCVRQKPSPYCDLKLSR